MGLKSPLLIEFLKRGLSKESRDKIRRVARSHFPRLQSSIYRILFGNDLCTLARLYGSDKWGAHWYAKHYQNHFAHLRKNAMNILEVGIGGYDVPEEGGASLRMWKAYFPNSQIFGLDICDKSPHDEDRIKTFKGSQVDLKFLDEVCQSTGTLDIVIDDGSHLNEHVLTTFAHLFPQLAPNGIYVVEDTQTSYWPNFKGSSENLGDTRTSMGFFKSLIDCLNHMEFSIENYSPTYYDRHIVGMHFYHNLVFIQKGDNNEAGSVQGS
jgi:hypothetical protein